MKVLVTGSEGYIGSIVAPVLAGLGHDVAGVDTGFYSTRTLYEAAEAAMPARRMDVRKVTVEQLEGIEAVVHLGELSNDPLGELNPGVTESINHHATVELARRCAKAGVSRFVYASSCSIYGAGHDSPHPLPETAPPNPQTAYARCKVMVERDVSKLADDGFSPTFLRNATAFGASPRMRFDLVLNNLSGWAWTIREIRLSSDGTPWRPLVHVRDITQAIACTLAAPRETIHNEVFNVGSSEQNYRVRDIAEVVAEAFPGCRLSLGRSDGDTRSYRVSFDKIHDRLPGFRCKWDALSGARELAEIFQRVQLTEEDFKSPAFTRLLQLKGLLERGELDEQLYWRSPAALG